MLKSLLFIVLKYKANNPKSVPVAGIMLYFLLYDRNCIRGVSSVRICLTYRSFPDREICLCAGQHQFDAVELVDL